MGNSFRQKSKTRVKKETASPRIYGLLGYPLTHSLSAAMHNAAFKKLKLNSLYLLFENKPDNFNQALEKLKLMRAGGFNVTIPYKERIIPHLDGLDAFAQQIGAVNTVVNQKGKFIGYNTDAPGFIISLKRELKFEPRGKSILIIGAGGAARAIGFALAKEKAKSIVFYDIDQARSEKLANDISKLFPDCSGSFINSAIGYPRQERIPARPAGGRLRRKLSLPQARAISLVVNASSAGMKKTDPLPITPSVLPKEVVVYDIIYNPSPTKLIKAVKAKGIKGINGLGMLLHQGALAFEIWTGKKAPLKIMQRALLSALDGKSN